MKKSILLLSTLIALFVTSCSQSKQFDSCSDMQSDLRDKNYSDLEKEFGEPIKKDYYAGGDSWNVIWSGVGVKGKDVELQFDNITYSWGSNAPFKVKGTVDCN